jgi:peptidoglycan/LPS O-acetylase OafA/YrhL
MRTARSQGHFESLDGLRGAAALAVVIHHSANVYLGTETRNLGCSRQSYTRWRGLVIPPSFYFLCLAGLCYT